jgi:hypothetical protein
MQIRKNYVDAYLKYLTALDIFEKLGSPNVEVVHAYITGLTSEMGHDDFNRLIENLRNETC